MNIEQDINILIKNKTYTSIDSKGNTQLQFSSTISCEEMINFQVGKVLVCFHENRHIFGEIGISVFNPDKEFEVYPSIPNVYINVNEYLVYIRSSASHDKKISLICSFDNAGIAVICFFYYIDENKCTEPKKYSIQCHHDSLFFKTFYFSQTNKFLFCCQNQGKFKYIFFHNTEAILESEFEEVNNCYGCFSMSIVYFSYNQQYSLITENRCEEDKNSRLTKLFSIDHFNEINHTLPSSFSSPESIFSSLSISLSSFLYDNIDYASSSLSSKKCDKYYYEEDDKCLDTMTEGFYLFDEKNKIIKKCHKSCKLCAQGPNSTSNNCQQCYNNSYYLLEGNCINDILCSETEPLFNKELNKCAKLCSVEELLNEKCIINRVTDNTLKILNENIRQIIFNYPINSSTNIIIKGNNIIFQISTNNNMKNNYNNIIYHQLILVIVKVK